jgi:hypothetical protein
MAATRISYSLGLVYSRYLTGRQAHVGQIRGNVRRVGVNGLFEDRAGVVSQVELGGLEPPTPCLQSDVSTRVSGPDLGNRLSLSDRHVPLRTGVNGTLMARDLGLGDRTVLRCPLSPDPMGFGLYVHAHRAG